MLRSVWFPVNAVGAHRLASLVLRPASLSQSRRLYSSNIHDRYSEKLLAKAKIRGVSVEELLKNAQPDVENVRKNDVADLVAQAQQFKKKRTQKDSDQPDKLEAVKAKALTMDLDSFIDVSKFSKHNSKEIEMLWKARFVDSPNGFSGCMSAEAFSRLYVNARKYPTFVLPLPHKAHGVELHYVQWSFVSSETVYCLITSLAQYKLHNEYAQPHTTFMLHTNFAADKGVILSNAVLTEKGISMENAALLVLNLQRFYAADPSSKHGLEKLELLKKFNTGDKTFTAEALINATETLD